MNYVSITPLHLDLTAYATIENIRSWNLQKEPMDSSLDALAINQTLTTP